MQRIKKRWRRILHILLVVSVLILLACLLILWLLQTVPQNYQTALAVENEVHQPHLVALQETVDNIKDDIWHRDKLVLEVSEQQINAWLATELRPQSSRALPEGIKQPRIELGKHQQTLYFKIERPRFTVVISIVVRIELGADPNTIEIRIVSVHAGSIPVRMKRAFDEIESAMARQGVDFQWKAGTNREVAVVTIPSQVRIKNKQKNISVSELSIDDDVVEVTVDLD
ncbi:MAG: hypothetical protein VB814_03305 [Pirellulaceae bacterium]